MYKNTSKLHLRLQQSMQILIKIITGCKIELWEQLVGIKMKYINVDYVYICTFILWNFWNIFPKDVKSLLFKVTGKYIFPTVNNDSQATLI